MKNKYIIIIIIISILLATSLMIIQSENDIEYEEVKIQVNTRTLYATFAIPEGGGIFPGVVVFHGFSATKEMMRPFVEGLAGSNMAVLAVDLQGHGQSSGRLGEDGNNSLQNDGIAAVQYLKSRAEVDDTRIAMLGHSMGAGTTFSTVQVIPSISASVYIGNDLKDEAVNTTNPRNMLMAMGKLEELFSVDDAVSTMERAVGHAIEYDTQYGDFADGTARKLLVTNTDHIFEVGNPQIISESISWIAKAFNVDISEVSGWALMGRSVLSTITALIWMSIFVAYFYVFRREDEVPSQQQTWIVHGGISVLAFIVGAGFLLFGFSFVFVGWFIVGGLLFAHLSKADKSYKESLSEVLHQLRDDRGRGMLVFLSLFIPIEIILLIIPIDFRYVLPVFAFVNIRRIGLMLLLWIPGIFYFTYELTSLPQSKSLGKSIFIAIIARIWPFLIILAVQYLPIIFFGKAVLPSMFGFLAFFVVGLVPVMIILTVISVIGLRYNHLPFTIATILAGYIAWILASTLPFN
ncbi:MAG: alpha/beta fold hydrolase [Candidatus Heimdallarchaeota archaeon]|nr:alpha/beta fold hydrolase [Candidatus Heimdallarchaeota archaeon]